MRMFRAVKIVWTILYGSDAIEYALSVEYVLFASEMYI